MVLMVVLICGWVPNSNETHLQATLLMFTIDRFLAVTPKMMAISCEQQPNDRKKCLVEYR